jgi:hypothetical protein
MTEYNLPQRTLRTTFWVAAFFTLVFGLRGETRISFGLAIGAAIGLSSLWSLTVAVPRLFAPGKPAPRLMLGMFTSLKLPLYAVVINYTVNSPYVSPFAMFIGVAFVPAVIFLKVIGQQLVQKTAEPAGEDTCRSKPAHSN